MAVAAAMRRKKLPARLREGLAASESAAQQPVRPVDEQASVVPGNWLLTTALTACEGVDRQTRAALTPVQTVRLHRDAARAIERAIIEERANMEAGIL